MQPVPVSFWRVVKKNAELLVSSCFHQTPAPELVSLMAGPISVSQSPATVAATVPATPHRKPDSPKLGNSTAVSGSSFPVISKSPNVPQANEPSKPGGCWYPLVEKQVPWVKTIRLIPTSWKTSPVGENHPTVDGAVEVEVAVAAVEPLSHRQLLAQVCRDLLTGTSARACSATAVASARSPQVRLRRLHSHLQLLHRCQHHGDDDEPCPCWAHNPAECKVPFLEPARIIKLCRVMWQECSNWLSFLHSPTHRRLSSSERQIGSCMDASLILENADQVRFALGRYPIIEKRRHTGLVLLNPLWPIRQVDPRHPCTGSTADTWTTLVEL